ncbi:YdcF family protein [Segetibacter koreensis]|uniref:YdcF family protein n=1 Tax=Segetibacter koreensis TaxID=398037 RepID=UPI00036336E6|nr:YdcF family protein [Segetibacter koreensis]
MLTLFEEVPDVKKLLATDSILRNIAKNKTDDLKESLKSSDKTALCYTSKMLFTLSEINEVRNRLRVLFKPGNALDKLVQNDLVPSGNYILYQHLDAKEFLVKAWEQDANGINYTLGVYAEGNKANYPNIDSISFRRKDPLDSTIYLPGYLNLLYNSAAVVAAESEQNNLFFHPSLTAALLFVEMNEREQAADFEPMLKGENKASFEKIKSVNWNNYKYSVILVPGAGPEERDVPLSAEGMLRCRLAAMQYAKGMAPFIVTSGGKVHPYKTKFCEAIEMKKYLMDKLHIPANAIIVEPHARHTTTNMRNTVRLIFRYGIPFNKAGITWTTKGQSTYITTTLIDRCKKELNEVPYKNGERLSETEVEFYPLIEALQINPFEPLDP